MNLVNSGIVASTVLTILKNEDGWHFVRTTTVQISFFQDLTYSFRYLITSDRPLIVYFLTVLINVSVCWNETLNLFIIIVIFR